MIEQSVDSDCGDLLKTVSECLEAKEYEDALRHVEKAIALRPADLSTWMYKADILQNTGYNVNGEAYKNIVKRKREIFKLETDYKGNEQNDLRILMSDLDAKGSYVDLNEAKRKLSNSKIAYAQSKILQEEIQPDGVIGSFKVPGDIGRLIGKFMFDVRLKTYQDELTDMEIFEHFKYRKEHKNLIDSIKQLKDRCGKLEGTKEYEETQKLYERLIDHLRDYTIGHIKFAELCINVTETISQAKKNSIYLSSKTKNILENIKVICAVFCRHVYSVITLPVRKFRGSYRSTGNMRVRFATTRACVDAISQCVAHHSNQAHVTNTDNSLQTTEQSLSACIVSFFKPKKAAAKTPVDQQAKTAGTGNPYQTTAKSMSASFLSFFDSDNTPYIAPKDSTCITESGNSWLAEYPHPDMMYIW